MSRSFWMKIGIGLLILAAVGGIYQVVAPLLRPLPVYMALPEVTLTNQDETPFDLSQTRGKVVVLSLIYTHCPDICPVTTSKMRQIQERIQTQGWADQVQLVTFTVDPQRDTPKVLKGFATTFQADFSNWVFLSGTTAQTDVLIKTLGLYVQRVYYINNTPVPEAALSQPAPNTPYLVNHTDRIFLADRQGNVRAIPPGSRTNVDDAMKLIQQLVQMNNGE